MNYWFLSAGVLSALAFLAHLIQGSKETRMLRVSEAPEQHYLQAFASFQLISVDLFLLALLLGWLAIDTNPERLHLLGPMLLIWMGGWLLAWLFSLILTKEGKKYFGKLPQWTLFLVLGILIYGGLGFR